MKFNYKKVATVLGSALMLGSTVAMAAAASFTPASFSDSGLALVVGANAANSDLKAAIDLTANLAPATSTTTVPSSTVTGGDSVLLEKSSDKLNLGNSASTVFVTSIDEDDMPTLLAPGTYVDDVNTEYDYTQKITLGTNLGLEHFSDSDYKDKTPTIGVAMAGSEHVLNYTLDFTTNPLFDNTTLETTNMVLMGRTYYVLDVINSSTAGADKVTLLDSANSVVVTEGETVTAGGKEISISYISSTEVKLIVDGQATNSLAEGGTYKLTDGTYVGIKDIMYNAKDAGISQAEISIGAGKLEILDTNQVELNDETVQEIVGFISLDSSAKVDKIVLQWTTDDEAFLATDSTLTMPGFETIKISMADFVTPAEEKTTVTYSGSDVIELKTTIKSGDITIPLLQTNSTGEFTLIGKDSSNRLSTDADTQVTVNQTAGDKYIVASWNSTTEAESYYLSVDFITEDNVNKLRFTDEVSGVEKKATNNTDVSFGNVVLTAGDIVKTGSLKWSNISINSGGSFNILYTDEGLKVYLPTNTTANGNGTMAVGGLIWLPGATNNSLATGHNFDSFYLYFAEEDKDGNLAKGDVFNVTLDDSSDKIQVSTVNTGSTSGTYGYEIEDSDDYESYVVSDLATKAVFDTGGDQDSVVITYFGDQAYAEMYVTAPSAVISGGSSGTTTSGVMTVYDNEVSSVSTKNLIVIGGSAVNAVASELLGGIAGGEAFTTATGIKAGEAIIKSFNRSGKVALLVAGYNAEDTTKAVTYLSNNAIDTTVGKALKVTSATSATAITA